mmetsp:Transcript_13620/g.36554  ORF Transcript_13620/g.36554 Transcript_13620/m.36554 type:complete len:206 (-) Transcript_13620:62-679(-)
MLALSVASPRLRGLVAKSAQMHLLPQHIAKCLCLRIRSHSLLLGSRAHPRTGSHPADLHVGPLLVLAKALFSNARDRTSSPPTHPRLLLWSSSRSLRTCFSSLFTSSCKSTAQTHLSLSCRLISSISSSTCTSLTSTPSACIIEYLLQCLPNQRRRTASPRPSARLFTHSPSTLDATRCTSAPSHNLFLLLDWLRIHQSAQLTAH